MSTRVMERLYIHDGGYNPGLVSHAILNFVTWIITLAIERLHHVVITQGPFHTQLLSVAFES